MSRSARCRMLFSKPLAYPSTLDRRKTASYVEELWSPSLVFSVEIDRLTLTHIPSAISQAEAQRVFLSQAGPRFGTTASSS